MRINTRNLREHSIAPSTIFWLSFRFMQHDMLPSLVFFCRSLTTTVEMLIFTSYGWLVLKGGTSGAHDNIHTRFLHKYILESFLSHT